MTNTTHNSLYTKSVICGPTRRVQVIMSICLIHSTAFWWEVVTTVM